MCVLINRRRHILSRIDPKHNMVLSTTGSADISKGEHRNVLSAILLNWQGTNSSVTIQQSPHPFPTLWSDCKVARRSNVK
ncbi:DUF3541 domain-containing protein [Vibrio pectenicida]|uniref:DUF3541 domain-containing protein n=1 Tax=Vibrio pectenicida TaxID=62763 RepID=UPI003F51A28A